MELAKANRASTLISHLRFVSSEHENLLAVKPCFCVVKIRDTSGTECKLTFDRCDSARISEFISDMFKERHSNISDEINNL